MTNATTEDERQPPRRRTMVDKQLRPRGISDPRVLDAMMTVPRELFVPPDLRDEAYENRALPLGLGQTISQPYIVAFMTQQLGLTPSSRTLEIGTGTGYQTAILALLSAHVYTVERFSALTQRARENLEHLNLTNVTMRIGDGSVGLPQDA
ncbi:MAG: methyltransferase domain-containing protein, partial [Planctomycetes bacterium]|nr:methyltransferase domain-containing protein [Planctomycetota bacterium]